MHWLNDVKTLGGVQDVQPYNPDFMQVAQLSWQSIDLLS